MAINPASVANAYANAAKAAANSASGAPGVPESGPSFADLIKDAVGNVVSTAKTAETQAVAGITKHAEITDVVAAVTSAELTLQTVVAVRDKVINAYQEIMKMPI